MTLRVAMVGACPYPVPQGSQVYLRDTALALAGRGHEVHLVVYGYGRGEDASGLQIHRCAHIPGARRTAAGPSLAKPLLDYALLRALMRVVRDHQIDVVCAHNYEALLVALAAKRRPVVYFAHNAMEDELPHFVRPQALARRAGRWLDTTFPRRASLVIAPHQRLAGYLAMRGCSPNRLEIIPPAIDTAQFLCAGAGDSEMRVLYAGNLDRYQNLPLLLDAMRQLRERLSGARLQIATPDAAQSIEGAEVFHTPDFESLRQVLKEDAVFAVPRVSWSGYPIKLLNAMAAGKAIVACESAAFPLTHRINGLVVPDNDSKAFASALHELLINEKLRRSLGQRARETVMQHHDPGRIAEALEAAIVASTSR